MKIFFFKNTLTKNYTKCTFLTFLYISKRILYSWTKKSLKILESTFLLFKKKKICFCFNILFLKSKLRFFLWVLYFLSQIWISCIILKTKSFTIFFKKHVVSKVIYYSNLFQFIFIRIFEHQLTFTDLFVLFFIALQFIFA